MIESDNDDGIVLECSDSLCQFLKSRTEAMKWIRDEQDIEVKSILRELKEKNVNKDL